MTKKPGTWRVMKRVRGYPCGSYFAVATGNIATRYHAVLVSVCTTMKNGKSAQRDANTVRAMAVLRFGHRPPAHPPAVTNPQTGLITIHCAAAS